MWTSYLILLDNFVDILALNFKHYMYYYFSTSTKTKCSTNNVGQPPSSLFKVPFLFTSCLQLGHLHISLRDSCVSEEEVISFAPQLCQHYQLKMVYNQHPTASWVDGMIWHSWSEGFLYKFAPLELKISPIMYMYFVMHNSVVLSKILKIVVPLEQNLKKLIFTL